METGPSTPAGSTPSTSPRSLAPDVAAAASDPNNRFGKYVRVARLGAGGMGEVWKAWDTGLNRWVALKFLRNAAPEDVLRFQREAELAAKLSHPNIAAIYEVGEAAGSPFIAMEFVDGTTFAPLRRGDRRRAVECLRTATLAVHAAHERGVVHRDLKPQNLMIDRSGRVFVMDFGLAKETSVASSLSVSGMAVGTPSYMPPEQARGDIRSIGPASDVYSLGATLYELLAGRPPFTGENVMDVMAKVVDEDPPPIPAVERDLETIAMKCLEKDPARRFPSAKDLADELGRWLEGEPILAHPPSLLYRWKKRIAKRRGMVVLGAVAAVLLAAAIAWPFATAALERRRLDAARRDRADDAGARVREAAALLATDAARAEETAARTVETCAPFAALGETLPVAQARLIVARARMKRGDSAGALREFAWTYRDGAASTPPEREAAAEALLEIGRWFLDREEFERARGALGALIARFPDSPSAAAARPALASALQALGLHAHALALGPDAESAALLRGLLPVSEHVFPDGAISLGNLDGDARPEAAVLERGGRLTIHRLAGTAFEQIAEARVDPWIGEPRVTVADLDGDGADDIVTASGSLEQKKGFVQVWKWSSGALVPGPVATIESHAQFLEVRDLDGDGRPELIVPVGIYARFFRLYRLDGDRLVPLAKVSCGPEFTGSAHAVFRPGQGLQSLYHQFGWGSWSLLLVNWDGKALQKVDYYLGQGSNRAGDLLLLPDNRVVLAFRRDRALDRPLADKGITPDKILADGLYLVDPREKLADPKALAAGDFASIGFFGTGGVRHLAVLERRDDQTLLSLRPLPDAPGRTRVIESRLTRRMELLPSGIDLDGDGDEELILRGRAGGRLVLRVYGLGPAPPPTPLPATATGGSLGADLLQFGLVDQAEEEFKRAGDHLGLGRVFIERRKWADAARELGQETARRTDALRLQVQCHERLRDWRGLAAALDALLESPDLDRFEREAAATKLEWASEAAGMRERGALPTLLAAPVLFSESPVFARRNGDELDIIHRAGTNFAMGVPLQYGGGAIRLEYELYIVNGAYECPISMGLDGPRGLAMHLDYAGAGGALRSLKTSLRWRGSPTGWTGSPSVDFWPELKQWYKVAIEFVPRTERAILTIDRGDGHFELATDVPRTFERGLYRFGKVTNVWTIPLANDFSIYRVRNLRVLAGDPSTRFDAPSLDSARDLLQAANGDVLAGRIELALKRYQEALGRAGTDRSIAAQARFYRGLVLLRTKRVQEGLDDVKAARELDGAKIADIVEEILPFLGEELRSQLKP